MKLSSSASEIAKIRSDPVTNSGYCGPIALMELLISSPMIKSWDPSRRIFLIVRRIIRRNTYPRPSFPGVTPSPISIIAVRAWSAMTRRETSDFSSLPYLTFVNADALSRIIFVVSIS